MSYTSREEPTSSSSPALLGLGGLARNSKRATYIPAPTSASSRGDMPVEWEGDRQRVRARARRRMISWAIVSMCMVSCALYGKVLTHRKVGEDITLTYYIIYMYIHIIYIRFALCMVFRTEALLLFSCSSGAYHYVARTHTCTRCCVHFLQSSSSSA